MSSRPARGAARLAAILDALPDALLLVNGNGTVVNANSIAVETLEAPSTPLVGRGLLDLLPSFDPRKIPGSMRPETGESAERTKPTRMTARRTDGVELPVEVTSAQLPAGHSPYASPVEAAFADDYGGDELLMLVVRDLSGALDTEAELSRQQRQTEMILRAASEGVVGVDAAGRVVLVNPAAAQLLGHRAGQLGGQDLYALAMHAYADGSPRSAEETPLHDTLISGRRHRVRGQALWTKDGQLVPVDMTTAPVREGDQLVGAVVTFTDRRPQDALVARHAQLDAVLAEGLRGPLEQLSGELSELAADPAGQLWPEANQVLRHLAAGHARITRLIDNVLSFQRLDAGTDALDRRAVSIDAVINAAVEGATELMGPGRAQFAVHAPQVEVEVDQERLALALAHLVADVAGVDATGHAQATGSGAGDSTIVLAAALRGDMVRIEVRGPYTGGDPVHAPLVRGIVRLHGGVLQTHEVPGAADGRAYVLEVPVRADHVPMLVAPRPAGASGETTVVPLPAEPIRGMARQGTAGGPVSDGRGVPAGAAGGSSGDQSAAGTAGGARGAAGGPVPAGQPGTRARQEPLDGQPGGPRQPQQGQQSHGPQQSGGSPTAGPPQLNGQVPENGQPAPDRPQLPQALPAGQPPQLPSPAGGAVGAPHGSPVAGPVPHQGVPALPPPVATPGSDSGAVAVSGAAGASGAAGVPGPPGGQHVAELDTPTGRRRRQQNEELPAASHSPQLPGAAGPHPEEQQSMGHQVQLAMAAQQGVATQQPGPQPGQPDSQPGPAAGTSGDTAGGGRRRRALAPVAEHGAAEAVRPAHVQLPQAAAESASVEPPQEVETDQQPSGRRRRVDAPQEALPAPQPAASDVPAGNAPAGGGSTRDDEEPLVLPAPDPATALQRAQAAPPHDATGGEAAHAAPTQPGSEPAVPAAGGADAAMERSAGAADEPEPAAEPQVEHSVVAASPILSGSVPQPEQRPRPSQPALPMPGAARAADPRAAGVHVQTLGQGIPVSALAQFTEQRDAAAAAEAGGQNFSGPQAADGPPRLPQQQAVSQSGSHAPQAVHPGQPAHHQGQQQAVGAQQAEQVAQQVPHPYPQSAARQPNPVPQQQGHQQPAGGPAQQQVAAGAVMLPGSHTGQRRKLANPQADDRRKPAAAPAAEGRRFAIGAPAAGSGEGPEMLDGPGGAVEVTDTSGGLPIPQSDAELPPEPLDNPRRLLVWPEPDVATQQALTERGYRPVLVQSQQEVDAQVAAYPAALFVDPLTGPITRSALQTLRQAAVNAGLPVLVTAGLGQASKDAAYGADPAVLLKALAPRDSEQHPPRVLLVEEQQPIADALAMSLERRGMQVAKAPSDSAAMEIASGFRPNLVVMDLSQVRRRRASIVDWLRVNGLLSQTPFVVYTAADLDQQQMAQLVSGETVLFLAERSTDETAQSRIVDLLAKIGAQ